MNIEHADCNNAFKGIKIIISPAIFSLMYSMMGLLIRQNEPFWQEINVVSDAQETVETCGPLVCDPRRVFSLLKIKKDDDSNMRENFFKTLLNIMDDKLVRGILQFLERHEIYFKNCLK